MTRLALQWFHWLHNTNQLSTWDAFAHNLEIRFGPSSFQNHEAALYKLRQITNLSECLTEFEAISTPTTGLSHNNLLNCFLSGLMDDIQRELFLLQPQSLPQAMGMAKLVEDKLNASKALPTRFSSSHPFQHHLPPSPPPSLTPPVAQASKLTTRPSPLPIGRLTPTEMAA